jgi:hypothetical protein
MNERDSTSCSRSRSICARRFRSHLKCFEHNRFGAVHNSSDTSNKFFSNGHPHASSGPTY